MLLQYMIYYWSIETDGVRQSISQLILTMNCGLHTISSNFNEGSVQTNVLKRHYIVETFINYSSIEGYRRRKMEGAIPDEVGQEGCSAVGKKG